MVKGLSGISYVQNLLMVPIIAIWSKIPLTKVLCGGFKTNKGIYILNWNSKIPYKGLVWRFKDYIIILDPKSIQIGPRELMLFSYPW